MAIDLSSIPTPLFAANPRSALELTRRMLLLHWSAGKYLDTVAGNYGVKRPPLGFSDDDFFRAVTQILMADYKAIGNSFWQLLEVVLGPYENLTFRVEKEIIQGSGYFDISKDIEFIKITGWNSIDFQSGETIGNGLGVLADVVYHDKEESKLHFISRRKGDFAATNTITGVTSGGIATSSGSSLRVNSDREYPVTDRLPLYGQGTIFSEYLETSEDSGVATLQLPNNASILDDFYNGWSIEIKSGAAIGDIRTITDYDGATRTITVGLNWSVVPTVTSAFKMSVSEGFAFASVDKYIRRVRVVNDFQFSHPAGSAFFIDGGCWEFIEAKARRVAVKIKCEDKLKGSIPGSSYLHPLPWKMACLREDAVQGSTILKIDDSALDGVPAAPFNIIVDPEERLAPLELFDVNGYNATTREFSTLASLARTRRRGVKIKWVQADVVTGGLTTGASPVIPPAVQELKSVARYENVVGLWVLDRGGPGEEVIFVTGTTYQRRQLTSQITPLSTLVSIDYPFDRVPEGPLVSPLTFRVFDSTGYLGVITATSIFNYDLVAGSRALNAQLGLSAAPGFSTDILNEETYLELVDTASGEVTWTVARPIQNTHLVGVSMERWYGTIPVIPTESSHLPEAGWPPPVTSEGKWPGPYVFSSTRQAPAKVKATQASTVEAKAYIARNDASDARIYLSNVQIEVDFNPGTAKKTLPKQIVIDGGANVFEFQPINMIVTNASAFPTTAQVNSWRGSPSNPRAGYPTQVVVGGEGRFGRAPLYYWGRGLPGTQEENTIYVSGVTRLHDSGTQVATYNLEIPIEALPGVLGVSGGLPLTEDVVILDHMDQSEEILFYDSLQLESPTRGLLIRDRGYIPEHEHYPFKMSNVYPSVVLGSSIIRTASLGVTQPRIDGFSFPFVLNGSILFLRLSFVMDIVRAAGVKVEFYDHNDKKINVDLSNIIQLSS